MELPIDQQTLILILISLCVILIIWIILLEFRTRRLTRGASGKSLESIINNTAKQTALFEGHFNKVFNHIDNLDRRTSKGIQGYGIERFNAYGEAGGNQSFATALVDEHGDGMVLSSLYARDRISLYIKPVDNFVSQTELTPEEEKVLDSAKKRVES